MELAVYDWQMELALNLEFSDAEAVPSRKEIFNIFPAHIPLSTSIKILPGVTWLKSLCENRQIWLFQKISTP